MGTPSHYNSDRRAGRARIRDDRAIAAAMRDHFGELPPKRTPDQLETDRKKKLERDQVRKEREAQKQARLEASLARRARRRSRGT